MEKYMNNIKFFLVAGLLAVACFVSLSSYLPERFDTTASVKMAAFPMKVGSWVGKDVPLTKRDYDILETDNLIMREYSDPAGRKVLLYIIYSENNRKVAHPPEVCYTGGGSTITSKSLFTVSPKIKATRMITEASNGLRQFVIYWFKAGDFNTSQYLDQQLKVAWQRTIGKKTSAAMIRISADIKDSKEDGVGAMIREFAQVIEPLLPKYVP
jgi:EpsI family protein